MEDRPCLIHRSSFIIPQLRPARIEIVCMSKSSARRSASAPGPAVPVEELSSATICLAGDAGDGIALVAAQFTQTAALVGNDLRVLPEQPAEIRAPAGSLANVAAVQIQFGSAPVHTPGDKLHALVALNPAALKTHLAALEPGGILIANQDAFTNGDLVRAGYTSNPLTDGSLAGYRVLSVPITTLNRAAVGGRSARSTQTVGAAFISQREVDRCKNFFALGLVYWLYERPLDPTLHWIADKHGGSPGVCEAEKRALKAGYHYGETVGVLPAHYRIAAAPIPPGKYRRLTGSEGVALGLLAGAQRAGLQLVFAGYPILPSSDVLHFLAERAHLDATVFQAEDEAAAAGAALGASFGGALGATATSGPGLCLITETLGLAVMTELPLVVVDVQRAGPSTGLPTKTDQADLFLSLFGRHGECPLVVLAAASPADCFAMSVEAVRLAVEHMTPVILLSDGTLTNGAEPWRIPSVEDLPAIQPPFTTGPNGHKHGHPAFLPYARDDRLVRSWAVPGTPGLEHRLGGLEKEPDSGDVSYDAEHHAEMVRQRAEKVARIAECIPAQPVVGPESGDLLVIGWGGTGGSLTAAVERCQKLGHSVAHAQLRYLNPLPANLAQLVSRYKKVLVAELNTGQLRLVLQGVLGRPLEGLNKVQGRPFCVAEIEARILELVRDA
jgi:2-oxoglutarate ferredoxin oxidoreductase subunit alpha